MNFKLAISGQLHYAPKVGFLLNATSFFFCRTTCGSNGIFSRRLDFSLYNVLPKQRINSIEVKVIMEISFKLRGLLQLCRKSSLFVSGRKFLATAYGELSRRSVFPKLNYPLSRGKSLKPHISSGGFDETAPERSLDHRFMKNACPADRIIKFNQQPLRILVATRFVGEESCLLTLAALFPPI